VCKLLKEWEVTKAAWPLAPGKYSFPPLVPYMEHRPVVIEDVLTRMYFIPGKNKDGMMRLDELVEYILGPAFNWLKTGNFEAYIICIDEPALAGKVKKLTVRT
jgi:hypothetical protein